MHVLYLNTYLSKMNINFVSEVFPAYASKAL